MSTLCYSSSVNFDLLTLFFYTKVPDGQNVVGVTFSLVKSLASRASIGHGGRSLMASVSVSELQLQLCILLC